jgi:predicted nucleic acid-binding protein
MGVIFETSVLITLERGSQLVAGRESEPFGINVITVSELLQGVHRADSEKRRLTRGAFVEKIIQTFPICPFDLNAARIYAKLWSNIAKEGMTIGADDLMIASTAIALGFSVITADMRDYSKIKEVSVEKFTV